MSTEPDFPYRLKVISLIDDPGDHVVRVVTAPAGLVECLESGSVRLSAEASPLGSSPEEQAKDLPLPLDATVIEDDGTNTMHAISGRLNFAADFRFSPGPEFNSLISLTQAEKLTRLHDVLQSSIRS